MHPEQARTIGQRLREIRHWRGKSLRVIAELAGITESYLCRLELGQRPLDRRSLLEALAAALEVAPEELTGAHELTSAEGMGEVHAAVVALRVTLVDNALDDPADETGRSWAELVAALHRMNRELRPQRITRRWAWCCRADHRSACGHPVSPRRKVLWLAWKRP